MKLTDTQARTLGQAGRADVELLGDDPDGMQAMACIRDLSLLDGHHRWVVDRVLAACNVKP